MRVILAQNSKYNADYVELHKKSPIELLYNVVLAKKCNVDT